MNALTRQARILRALTAVVLLAACDFPSEAPNWDMTWNVPAQSTSISVSTFLPAGVTLTPSGNAFQASVAQVGITRTLGTDCPPCATQNGLLVAKPAFTSAGSGSASLPAGLSSATLSGDTMTVTIQNAFNFDPIRPAALVTAFNAGTLTITVTSGSTTIGSTTLNGATSTLPSGAATTVKIPLSGVVSATNGVQMSITLNSPAGDPVRLNSALQMAYAGRVGSATLGTLVFSSATVTLTNQLVTSTPTDLSLDISSDIRDHVETGTIFLTITNPFAVTGNLNVNFTGGPSPVTKSVPLQAGTSTPRIDFTTAEIRAVLAAKQLNYGGRSNGATTVAPNQKVAVSSRIQLTISTVTSP